MIDTFTPKRRSEVMASIRSKDTNPEILVRHLVHRLGYRYRLHQKELPGKPDLVFSGRRAVIFVHGCFWHQHASSHCKARPPRSKLNYWLPKLRRNVERDAENLTKLKEAGWRVFVVWECETKNPVRLEYRLRSFLNRSPQGRG